MAPSIRSIRNILTRGLLIFILADSLFLLFTHLINFIYSAIETILLGIPAWISLGFISIYIIYGIVYLLSLFKKDYYLIKNTEITSFRRRLDLFLTTLDMTVTPTLFIFGVLNFVLNYFNYMLNYGIYLFMFLLVFVLGIFMPLINIIKDSDLVIIKKDERLVQPVGKTLLMYLRGISGLTALLGFLYTLIRINLNLYDSLMVLMALLTVIYPPIIAICFAYNIVHRRFVKRLNNLFEKRFKRCRMIIEIGEIKDSGIIIKEIM